MPDIQPLLDLIWKVISILTILSGVFCVLSYTVAGLYNIMGWLRPEYYPLAKKIIVASTAGFILVLISRFLIKQILVLFTANPAFEVFF